MNRAIATAVLLACGCGGAAFEVADGGGELTAETTPEASPPASSSSASPKPLTLPGSSDSGSGSSGEDAGASPRPGAESGPAATSDAGPEKMPGRPGSAPDAGGGLEAALGPDAPLPLPEASACALEPAATLFCGSGHITGPGTYCHTTQVVQSPGMWTWTFEATPTPAACQCAGAFSCACLGDAGVCAGQTFHCNDIDGGGPVPWCS